MTLVKHSKRTIRKPCKRCGSKELYWGHDTDRFADYCTDCGVNGKFVLMNMDGTQHDCTGSKDDHGDPHAEDIAETPVNDAEENANVSTPTPTPVTTGDDMAALQGLLQRLLGTPQIDRAEVERIARDVIEGVVFPTRTVVVKDDVTRKIEGDTHKQLADVTTAILAGEHVMMVGPAGTGKSTIAEQASEALGLSSYSISLSPQTPASAFLGYMNATGDYVRTLFREAYENGGVFHFDEVDNAHPSILAVINAALANGHMAFPDGMVKRHADFRAVASANTYGRGATRAYVGRSAIDAATLDRFTVITIDIDEALESALSAATGAEATTVDKVLTFVRKLRRNAERNGLNVVVSPRASIGMCRLLVAGMSWDMAVDARVRRGLDDATWSKLNA